MSLPPFEMTTADAATTEWLRRSDRGRIAALLAFLGLTVLVSAGRERAEFAAFLTLGLWLITALIAERVLRYRRNGDRLRAVLLAADITWITVMLQVTGVAQRTGVAAYMFIVAIAAGALSRRVTAWLTLWAITAYGVLLAAESTPDLRPALVSGSVVVRAPSARLAAWLLGSAALIALAYLMRTLVSLLARTEARHRLLFWASPRPMYMHDAETLQFLAVNDAAVREYGYAREELLTMTSTDITVQEEGSDGAPGVLADHGTHKHAGTWRHH